MNNKTEIPEGYMANARGDLVRVENVRAIDMERDKLVRKVIAQALALQASMAAFKNATMGDIETFIDRSLERYKVEIGGKKGNVSLTTFDGEYQLKISQADRITFDEGLLAAKSLVDDCLRMWTHDSRPEIRTIIEQAFDTDKEGKINTGRILTLMRLEIKDATWCRAMDALKESIKVTATVPYLRLYKRRESDGKYEQIPLDIAAL